MSVDSKQLHNLSRIYREKIAEESVDEGMYDAVKTVMDKGSNFVKKNPVGKALGKVVAPMKSTDGGVNRKSATAASQKAKGLTTEENVDEGVMDTLKGIGSFIKNPKATIQKKVDSALTGATKKGKMGPIKVGGSAKYTGSMGAPNAGSYKMEGLDPVGKEDSDVNNDGKVDSSDSYLKKRRAAIGKAMGNKGKKVKESYSNWRQDLKEVPNYDQIPASGDERNKKIEEKKVKNTIKINPEMKEEVVDEGLLDMAKKAVNKKMATAGRNFKGGSVSQMGNYAEKSLKTEEIVVEGEKDACYHKVKSRYSVWPSAYASGALVKCRRKGAANWGNSSKKTKKEELDILSNFEFEIISEEQALNEGYQRNPEADPRSARQKRMDDPEKGINSPKFRAFMAAQQGGSKSKKKKEDK